MMDFPAFITKVTGESQSNAQYMLIQACYFLKLESRYAGAGIDENGVLEDLRAICINKGYPVTGVIANTLPSDAINDATVATTDSQTGS